MFIRQIASPKPHVGLGQHFGWISDIENAIANRNDKDSLNDFIFLNFMKVIGAGFGRTGTLSLKKALEELGEGPCYHMKTALTRPWQIPFWLNADHKSTKQWKRFFRHYNATVDWPASEFYHELTKIWPDAKVILTVRDPVAWYNSSLETIYRIQTYFPWWFPKIFVKLQEKHIWHGRFHGKFEDQDFAIDNYLTHIEEVKRNVPAEKLLVYNIKEGWEPLCKFLKVPVPDKPFPNIHDKTSYLNYIRKVKIWMAVSGIAGITALITIILYLLLHYF